MKVILQQNSKFLEKAKKDKLTMVGECKKIALEATQKLWDEVELRKAKAKAVANA
jgi:hypothetical protein